MRVTRIPKADEYAAAAGIEHDRARLRLMGWLHEEEYGCCSCGLYAMGMEEFAVCVECLQCKECGCDADCKQSEGWSCE